MSVSLHSSLTFAGFRFWHRFNFSLVVVLVRVVLRFCDLNHNIGSFWEEGLTTKVLELLTLVKNLLSTSTISADIFLSCFTEDLLVSFMSYLF